MPMSMSMPMPMSMSMPMTMTLLRTILWSWLSFAWLRELCSDLICSRALFWSRALLRAVLWSSALLRSAPELWWKLFGEGRNSSRSSETYVRT